MTFTNYQLNRMISDAISVFIGQEFGGFDSSTDTPDTADTTMDSELGRFFAESVTLNTSTGRYTISVRIPLQTLDGETIRRFAQFDAATNGEMGSIENLPSAYFIDTVHEVRLTFTIDASALDEDSTILNTEGGDILITEGGTNLLL